MFSIVPPLLPKASITGPTFSSGTSICTSSYGSQILPSTSLKITSGFDTWSSYPSLLIFSINIDRWSSPLPDTIQLSESFGSIFNDTSLSDCFLSLSSILEAVTNLPSLPANGDELTPKVIWSVGSSILKCGSASSFPSVHIVSPTSKSGRPAIATISPAFASCTSILLSPK